MGLDIRYWCYVANSSEARGTGSGAICCATVLICFQGRRKAIRQLMGNSLDKMVGLADCVIHTMP